MPTTYQKNFLTDVIFRVDFSPILELETDTPKKFQSLISEKFPVLEPIKQMGFIFQSDGKETTTKNADKTIWRFKTTSGEMFIELDSMFLAVVFKKYDNFTQLKEIVDFCIQKLYESYPNIAVNRLGLRYINQINLEEQDFFNWTNYLSEHLVGNLNFIEDKNLLRRYFNSFEIMPEDGIQLNFKYGIFNKTYPEAVTVKEFVLDYDCYTQSTLTKDELVPKLTILNNYATDYFEKSISDNLRQKLNNNE